MRKNVLLFFIGITTLTFANTIPNTLIYKDSVLLFQVHNYQVVTIFQDKEQNHLLSVNEKIDTLQIDINSLKKWRSIPAFHNDENSIYFANNDNEDNNLYKLNLDTKEVSIISTVGNYYYLIKNTLITSYSDDCYDYVCDGLVFTDLNTNKSDTIVLGDFTVTDLLPGNKILIRYYESGSVINFGYYDWNKKELISSIHTLNTMEFETFFSENGEKYQKVGIDDIDYAFTDITGKYSNIRLQWLDTNFNIIQPTLESYPNKESTFRVKKKNSYYYRSSIIEGKKQNQAVWVPCKFTLSFDKALYDIYNGVLLENSIVQQFDSWELYILRNMVYAKHGYQFSSEYLQAFFYLFDFYNKINRKKDVNDLLTPIDKNNLQLIQEVSKLKNE